MKETKKLTEVINGETAIKPYYYYMRNGLLHIRYTVDRAVELSENEETEIKKQIEENPLYKQLILKKQWQVLTRLVGKPVIHDGIEAAGKVIKDKTEKYEHEN